MELGNVVSSAWAVPSTLGGGGGVGVGVDTLCILLTKNEESKRVLNKVLFQ